MVWVEHMVVLAEREAVDKAIRALEPIQINLVDDFECLGVRQFAAESQCFAFAYGIYTRRVKEIQAIHGGAHLRSMPKAIRHTRTAT